MSPSLAMISYAKPSAVTIEPSRLLITLGGESWQRRAHSIYFRVGDAMQHEHSHRRQTSPAWPGKLVARTSHCSGRTVLAEGLCNGQMTWLI